MEQYVVRNKEGKYFKSRGFDSYKERWVDNLEDAKIYQKIGTAKAQITYWARHFPEYGVPDLIILETMIKEVVPQGKRVKESIENIKRREKQYEINRLEWEKKRIEEKIKLASKF